MVMCLTTGLYERAAELAPIIEDVAERLDVSTVTEDSYGAGAWATLTELHAAYRRISNEEAGHFRQTGFSRHATVAGTARR